MPAMVFFLTTNHRVGRNLRYPQDYPWSSRDAGLEECLFMGNLDALRDGAMPETM